MAAPKLSITTSEFEEIRKYFVEISGNELDVDRIRYIESRLFKIIRRQGLSVADYIKKIKENADHRKEFVSALTTHKTDWFREPSHFDFIRNYILSCKESGRQWMFWSGACSTGEEVYSLIITLLESNINKYRVLGTDISDSCLQEAERGLYERALVEEQVPFDILKKYFKINQDSEGSQYEIGEILRGNIKWRHFNLMSSGLPAGVEFDFIFLRNVLIYFSEQTRERVVDRLLPYLKKDGFLILGHSEYLPNCEKFNLARSGNSIYQFKGEAIPNKEASFLHAPLSGSNAVVFTVRVLIVDDSSVVRRALRQCLSKISGFEVVGEAADGIVAEEMIDRLDVDVITLDMNMPNKDGVGVMRDLGKRKRQPGVIIISDLSASEASPVLEALELGAFDYLHKPALLGKGDQAERLEEIIRYAYVYGLKKRRTAETSGALNSNTSQLTLLTREPISLIAIGASTGGTAALREVIPKLNSDSPPVLIVQHMPKAFTGSFSQSLGKLSKLKVVEATDGLRLERGHVYIAPGDKQMGLSQSNSELFIILNDDVGYKNFKPSVSYLFESISKLKIAKQTFAAILTGMGSDGADGLLKLRSAGARTVAQDEESCAIYGMPRAAMEIGAAELALPLEEIVNLLNKK